MKMNLRLILVLFFTLPTLAIAETAKNKLKETENSLPPRNCKELVSLIDQNNLIKNRSAQIQVCEKYKDGMSRVFVSVGLRPMLSGYLSTADMDSLNKVLSLANQEINPTTVPNESEINCPHPVSIELHSQKKILSRQSCRGHSTWVAVERIYMKSNELYEQISKTGAY